MACRTPYYQTVKDQIVPVSCGRCPDCKRTRTKQWAFRMEQEEKVSSSCYFITLTWDTENIPINRIGQLTLEKSEKIITRTEWDPIGKKFIEKSKYKKNPESVSAFIKRLRRYQLKAGNQQPIRYYAVGEYGEQFERPHYHIIIFNLIGAKRIGKLGGYIQYEIPDVTKAWSKNKKPRGIIHIGEGTGASASYCAKYIDKHCNIGRYKGDERVPRYSVMSKGIGKNYLTKDVEQYHKSDLTRTYVINTKGHKVAMPKYYKERLYSDTERERIQVLSRSTLSEETRKDRERIRKLYKKRLHPDDYKNDVTYNKFISFEKQLKIKKRHG